MATMISRDTLLAELKHALDKDPSFRNDIYRILEQHFATREELREYMQQSQQQFRELLERSDQRFEAMQKQLDERFDIQDKKFDDLHHWVDLVVGGFQRRAGRNLEDAVAGTLRIALKLKDVRPDKIKLRQKVIDANGMIGRKGQDYEYDILVSNGQVVVFEIKSVIEREEIRYFNDVAELIRHELNVEPDRFIKAIVTLEKTDEIKATCQDYGILLG